MFMKLKLKFTKNYRIFGLYLQRALTYRGEFFLWTLIDAMPLLTMIVLWFAVYHQGNQIGQFDFKQLLTYYLIGHLMGGLISVHFEEEGIKWINDGTISTFFLRPFSFFKHAIVGALAWRTFKLIVTILPLIVIIALFFPQSVIAPKFITILCLIMFTFIGFCLDSLLSFAIVAIAFFFEQAKALIHLKWILDDLFDGSLLPLMLYPNWFQKIARFLPFQYRFAFPLEIYLGYRQDNQILLGFIYGLIWVLILAFLVRKLWQKALYKFTAVGN
jgi:ABC-2 type transport system permease protein